jgi:hypothetical protein
MTQAIARTRPIIAASFKLSARSTLTEHADAGPCSVAPTHDGLPKIFVDQRGSCRGLTLAVSRASSRSEARAEQLSWLSRGLVYFFNPGPPELARASDASASR